MLERLAGLVGGEQPIDGISSLLAGSIPFHMDGFTTTLTAATWKRWVRFMHARGAVHDLGTSLDEIRKHADGTVTAIGRWSGLRNGRREFSEACSARYRIRDGRLQEIWTSRRNYTFPLGSAMRSRLGLLLTWLRVSWWSRGRSER